MTHFEHVRSLESQLFGVTALDPLSYVGGSVALLAMALLASWLPAQRAARTDVAMVLKAERRNHPVESTRRACWTLCSNRDNSPLPLPTRTPEHS